MTEGVTEEDSSAGLVVVVSHGAASPTGSGSHPGPPKASDETQLEEEEEGSAAGGSEEEEEGAEGTGSEEGGEEEGGEGERGGGAGPLGLLGLAGACCVCVQGEQVRGCLRSERICIVPLLACLLSLALCTAGLKWVFVDKIFEYEPPTHLDPDRWGQDHIIFADPTLGLPVAFPHPTSPPAASAPPSSARPPVPGQPEVVVEGKPTGGPYIPLRTPRVTQYTPTSAILTYRTDTPTRPGTPPTTPKPVRTPRPQTTPESNDIVVPHKPPATSTTPAVKTSSHVTRCSDSQRNYCVNGGECFTLEVTPGSTKFLCRCSSGYTGNRCQVTVPVRVMNPKQHLGIEFMEAEELYQKRVLTIAGICIALLVVGIMCVVAYCKTKKQRKKLHDRLRQSLRQERNNMASMANGPHLPNPPLENVQLVNQYVNKSAMPAQHVLEKETETSFSTSQYTSSTHASTTATHTSSQSWSNGRSDSVLSDGESRHAAPSQRGRLNGTGWAWDVTGHQKHHRDTPDSYRDSPYSERYVSAMTTPTRLAPVTPGSPPSETSAPLSSLATSVPSVAVSPSGEEERPLLFSTPPRPRDHKQARHQDPHSNSKRNSAHYNQGLDAPSPSPPPSPLRIVEDDDYETTQEYEPAPATTAATNVEQPSAPPQNFPQNLIATNTNNNNGHGAKRTKSNGVVMDHKMESNSDIIIGGVSGGVSEERSTSESEAEDERVGEDTPFLTMLNPLAVVGMETASASASAAAAAAAALRDSSRTNAGLLLSPQDDITTRLSSVIANQDPIAV